MDRLVKVESTELEIDFRPSVSCSVKFVITNLMHTMTVAVNLTTTAPRSYSLSPVTPSLLPPLSSATFTLTLTASDRPPVTSPPDSVQVRSSIFPTGKPDPAALRRIFAVPGVHVFRDGSIPIHLVGPHVLDHLLLSSAETLESTFLLFRAITPCSRSELSSLLRRSAAAGNPSFVSALISAGADVDSRGSNNRSALSLAVSSGNLAAVEHLVSAGAKIDLSTDQVFHESAAANRTDMIAVLDRSAPAWADAADPGGRTPVHYAAANGRIDAIKACFRSGQGNPDRADSAGWTPLHCAASGGFSDTVEFLIDSSSYDPKLTVTKNSKKTAFDVAVEGGHSHLYDVLGLGDDLQRAATKGDLHRVKHCLSLGADANRRDANGWTPLHRAAFKGRTEVVEFLIDNGAKLDAVDDVGYTPLLCAAEAGRTEVAMVLIDRGSRKGLKGIKGSDLFKMKLDYCGANNNFVVPSFSFDNQVIGT